MFNITTDNTRVSVQKVYKELQGDVVEAHCYVVDIGTTDREQIHIAESITTDTRRFGHVGLCQLHIHKLFCTQLTKAYGY